MLIAPKRFTLDQTSVKRSGGRAEALPVGKHGETTPQHSSESVEQARLALSSIGRISGMSLQMAAAIEQQGQVTERTDQQAGRRQKSAKLCIN